MTHRCWRPEGFFFHKATDFFAFPSRTSKKTMTNGRGKDEFQIISTLTQHARYCNLQNRTRFSAGAGREVKRCHWHRLKIIHENKCTEETPCPLFKHTHLLKHANTHRLVNTLNCPWPWEKFIQTVTWLQSLKSNCTLQITEKYTVDDLIHWLTMGN